MGGRRDLWRRESLTESEPWERKPTLPVHPLRGMRRLGYLIVFEDPSNGVEEEEERERKIQIQREEESGREEENRREMEKIAKIIEKKKKEEDKN